MLRYIEDFILSLPPVGIFARLVSSMQAHIMSRAARHY